MDIPTALLAAFQQALAFGTMINKQDADDGGQRAVLHSTNMVDCESASAFTRLIRFSRISPLRPCLVPLERVRATQ
jgi:hypothetical protein